MGRLIQDLRYAARTLARAPGYALVAVVTLALGIGANTAVFSMVRALLLEPVSFEHLDRLVLVRASAPRLGLWHLAVPPADFHDFGTQSHAFAALAAWDGRSLTLGGGGTPENVSCIEVTPEFFSALSTPPQLGRVFRRDEAEPGAEGVVILSHGLWRRRFGGDPSLVGRTILLDGRPRLVAGVMPGSFDFPNGTDLWTPLAFTPEQLARRDLRVLSVIGLLAPGVTRAAAGAELDVIAARLARQYPESHADHGVWLQDMRQAMAGDIAPAFYALLLCAGALVLLIACANVASLLLARGSARRREVAIRVAMGASRARVVRQLLTESVFLSLLGAAVGMLVAVWGVEFMVRSIPPSVTRFIPGWQGFTVNGAVLAFATGLAVATGIAFGLAPAFQIARADAHGALKEGQRSTGGGLSGMRARRALVVAEVALALVMVSGAALVVQGFRRQLQTSPGFDPRGVLTMRVTLSAPRYAEASAVAGFDGAALERLRALPGVEQVALANRLPWADWGGNKSTLPVEVAGAPARRPEDRIETELRIVSAGSFEALRVPLLAGRDFSDRDRDGAEPAAVVSRALALKVAPGGDAIGHLIRIEHPRFGGAWRRVVGVCGDVTTTWWDPVPAPVCYLPATQAPLASIHFAVRARGDAAALAPEVKRALAGVDPELPVYEVVTLEQGMADLYSPLRLSAAMMGIFGALALVLASVGVYGVIAYTVSQRTHEIGVRLALGAQRGSVLALMVRQGLALAAAGLAFGLPAAYAMSRLAASKLFGVVTADSGLLVAIAAGLAAVAALASYLPARGATRVDPMRALRSE